MGKKEQSAIRNTIGDTEFGTSLKDLEDGDLSRGYSDPPVENYEGSLDPTVEYIMTEDDGFESIFTRFEGSTLHQGQIEPDSERKTHGNMNEYGFIRRPLNRKDVERN